MQVNEYDGVLLKDGREAIIIEKFDDTHFMVDAAQTAEEWGIIDITIDDIQKVTTRSSATK
ncbi:MULTISPECIES: hypothetical protein [Lapidilactobacillus]|uniref:Uncharacterized protein n=1 Tax=Lapidilactobacillus achengensis TaxID=2486000 RepID=A0ABW1UMJ7_9LACO|nr:MULTISPECIES: hypothetical protein [Lapidilactobacillus]